MKNKLLLICMMSLLDICIGNVFAQTSDSHAVELPQDSLYQKTIHYLQDNDFFIDCMDTRSGFVKAKKYIDREKLFSAFIGKRMELSIFVKPIDESKSSISLTIYTTALSRNPEFREEGICKDDALFVSIIQGIKSTRICLTNQNGSVD